MRKISILIIVTIIAITLWPRAQTFAFAAAKKKIDYAAEKRKIEKIYYSFDAKKYFAAISETEKKRDDFFGDWRLDYYLGIAYFQLGKILYNPNPKKAYECFDKSLDYLLEAEKIKPGDAELLALISADYGKKASLSTLKAIYFGIKAKNYIYAAYRADSSSPKVALIAAVHLMHLPESFGGDKKLAERELKKALARGRSGKDSLRINWADKPELFAYLAQLEILRGNKSKAKAYMKKALDLVPEYGFVKFDLRAQLKKIDETK